MARCRVGDDPKADDFTREEMFGFTEPGSDKEDVIEPQVMSSPGIQAALLGLAAAIEKVRTDSTVTLQEVANLLSPINP